MDHYLKNKNYIYKGKLYVPIITNYRSKIGMRLVTSDHKPNPKRDHFPAAKKVYYGFYIPYSISIYMYSYRNTNLIFKSVFFFYL